MLYIIIGAIAVITLIVLVVIVYYNKFQFAIIKINEAEENTEIYLQKKHDLIKRIAPVISKKLKIKNYLKESNNSFVDLNHFELNDKLNELSNNIYETLDNNEKLIKVDKLTKLLDEFNDNEENLVASIKYYNDTVVDFNKLVLSFPSNIVRLFFGYKKKEFYANEKREIYEILKEDKKVEESKE